MLSRIGIQHMFVISTPLGDWWAGGRVGGLHNSRCGPCPITEGKNKVCIKKSTKNKNRLVRTGKCNRYKGYCSL